MSDFGKTRFIQSMWMKDKFTGDVFIIFNSRELVNRIIGSQMGIRHYLRTLLAKMKYQVGYSDQYPSLMDFQLVDEPQGIIWRSFENRTHSI